MGMFDQMENKTKLIIVHTAKTEKYANYLKMLISQNDDKESEIVGVKDGSVETVIWTDKEYAAQKPTLSNMDHTLFIGEGKSISAECYGMDIKYDEYGMQYGWLGKCAFLKIAETPLMPKKLRALFEYAEEYIPEDIDLWKRVGKGKLKVNAVMKDHLLGPFGSIVGDIKSISKDIQYKCLTKVFYQSKNGLTAFLNE